jgi:hypothetical protein
LFSKPFFNHEFSLSPFRAIKKAQPPYKES